MQKNESTQSFPGDDDDELASRFIGGGDKGHFFTNDPHQPLIPKEKMFKTDEDDGRNNRGFETGFSENIEKLMDQYYMKSIKNYSKISVSKLP